MQKGLRAAESELHKGYETVAMNPAEPEPCKPLVADGGKAVARNLRTGAYCAVFVFYCPSMAFINIIHIT